MRNTAGVYKYKGWDISFFGNGYRLTRREKVSGKIVTKTADTLARARTIITNAEEEIKRRGI